LLARLSRSKAELWRNQAAISYSSSTMSIGELLFNEQLVLFLANCQDIRMALQTIPHTHQKAVHGFPGINIRSLSKFSYRKNIMGPARHAIPSFIILVLPPIFVPVRIPFMHHPFADM